MRLFYLFLFFSLRLSTRMYFRRRDTFNSPKGFLGRTIYVSNHAASFMDPLLVAAFRNPIVFFMTRSDIFKPLLKPILWASHMIPIYRQLDGDDTKGKNQEVFKRCTKILSAGRNLLIFGEGFTDDVFIRRLKPIKKGAIRIGFIALEEMNWKKKVYIAAVGCNYSEPNYMRSDILISTSDKICLNEYELEFKRNPNKVISDLTKLVELKMKEQITHVEDKNWAPFHENVMQLTRKGMNSVNYDTNHSLKDRWRYSQNLANWMNDRNLEENTELFELKSDVEGYFSLLKRFKLQERFVFDFQLSSNGGKLKELLFLLFMWPFAIVGAIHCLPSYLFVKRFTEKSFKRKVFWGSVKMLMGKAVIGIVNIPFIFLFYKFVYPSYLMSFGYYLVVIPFCGVIAYLYKRNLIDYKTKNMIHKMDISKVISKRKLLIEKIYKLIPVA